MKNYWCVSCGYHGDFKIDRKRNIKCESCGYEDISELSREEFLEETEGMKERTKKPKLLRKELKTVK